MARSKNSVPHKVWRETQFGSSAGTYQQDYFLMENVLLLKSRRAESVRTEKMDGINSSRTGNVTNHNLYSFKRSFGWLLKLALPRLSVKGDSVTAPTTMVAQTEVSDVLKR